MSLAPKQVGAVAAIADLPTGGAITLGATARIEQYRAVTIGQTTAGQTATLPAPVDATVVFGLDVVHVGSAALTMYGVTLTPGSSTRFTWDGDSWNGLAGPAATLPTIVTLTPTAQNTIPNVATPPRAGSPVQFFVNGDFVAAGLALSAAGVVTATPATVGYNIEPTDGVTIVYYV